MAWQLFLKKKGERKYHLIEGESFPTRDKAALAACKLATTVPNGKVALGWHPEPPAKGGKK